MGMQMCVGALGAAEAARADGSDRSLKYVDCPEHVSEIFTSGGTLPLELLKNIDVAILGEHHSENIDHVMEADFLRDFVVARRGTGRSGQPIAAANANGAFPETHTPLPRPAGGSRSRVALGLEMVDQELQPALDRFNSGESSVLDLYRETQWAQRWGWRFMGYVPIFEEARALGVPLVALDVPLEVQRRVQLGGLAVLSDKERARYLPDRGAFDSAVQLPGFLEYANNILLPTYRDLLHAGLLASADPTKATAANFLATQLLRDEAMATAAWRHIALQPSAGASAGSMVCLIGYNHVRFSYGVAQRLRRLSAGGGPSTPKHVETVLLNPTPEDGLSFDGESGPLLALPIEGLPGNEWPRFADYLWSDRKALL